MKQERKDNNPQQEPLTEEEEKLAEQLYLEGLQYNEQFRDQATRVGIHLSFMSHPGDKIISIHFREGMSELEAFADRPVSMGKQFPRNLADDLGKLAKMLEETIQYPELSGVESIVGLCGLSPKWGGKHGFIVKKWTDNPDLVAPFDSSIAFPSSGELSRSQPLSLFIHDRKSFISEFGSKETE